MPGTSSHSAMTSRSSERFGKWLVSAPPLVYLLFFFAIPSLIMVLASFRTPGEFGGLAPLVEDGKLVGILARGDLVRHLAQGT